MVSKKNSTPAKPSNLSSKLSTSKLSAASAVQKASFSPASLHLSLFASLIDGVDSQRLRVHDSANGRLRCDYAIDRGVTCNSLSWSTLDDGGKKKRKRKRVEEGNVKGDVDNVVIALGTNKGSILLFSPTEASLIGKLEGGHVGAVADFKFAGGGKGYSGWSCGSDGKLVEWNWKTQQVVRSISLPEATYATIAPANPFILAASHSVIAVDAHSQDLSLAHTFSASATPIHSLAASTDGLFFTAAESDRYINVFSLIQQRQLGALVAESDVKKIAVNFNNEGETVKPLILAAVTAEGIVEVFNVPFNADSEDTEQVTSKRKKALTAKSVAQVRIIRPKTSAPVAAVDVSIQNGDLIIAWPEGGASMAFERVRCLDVEEGRLLLQGLSEIVKTKQISIGGENGNGSKELEDLALREANTVVVSGDTTNNLEIEDSEAEPSGEESDAGSESEAEAEPSFGEKFQALKISASANALAAPATSSKALAAPSAGSLTTVLSQALRTNDQSLLESCFQVTDSKAILSTIRQLESPQAVVLLERLAEKIARKPGRAGSLGTWVRWTLVAHGGYLVSLPDLVKTLSALHSTLNTRAAALPRLLALQGRLDMLNAQLELRHSVRHEGQVGSLAKERNKISEEEVTYIEGQDNESSDEDEEVGMEGLMIEDANAIKRRRVQNSDEEMSEDEDLMNGVDSDEEDEDEEDDEDDDDDNSLLDLEAEEASEDEEEEDEDDDELDYDSEEGEDLGSDDTDEDEEMVVPKGKKGKALGRSKR